MNDFFTKFGNFHFLRWLGVLVVFISLIYIEEDFRGAHAWAATKAEWEAKGESFDRDKFIPPPVPEAQNLAALPLFIPGPMKDKEGNMYTGLPALSKAMRDDPPSNEIPTLGSWSKGELPDMPKITSAISANYAALFKDAKPPGLALAQFEAIYPFLGELRTASAARPLFRLELDYDAQPAYRRFMHPLVDLLRISKLLAVHAVLALHEKQGDLALADLKLNQELFNGARRDPALVSGYVDLGMRASGNVAIYDGLSEHLWSDAQLAGIEASLKPLDFLTDYQFVMRGELISTLSLIDDIREPAPRPDHDKATDDGDTLRMLFASGWFDDNKRKIATSVFRGLTEVDPKARRVYPEIAVNYQLRAEESANDWMATAPWNIFSLPMGPYATLPLQKFAEGQVSVDETRIACALERYRLAHGVYPATLAELAPAYLDEVPHDVMSGEPYRYRLNADGTFLLYSVGWNGKDDGGTIAFKAGDPKTIDYENGDWVWPTAKVR